ncbi:MAG: rhomboid family intramembrane serine protease [Citrobacter freundii]|nr:MAG: rhomboid family intramembrane serine protease [Citrobacter freundii]
MQVPQLNVTLVIVIITAIISIGAFNNEKIKDDLIFYPPYVTYKKQWYRFFTSGLIHANWGHLIFNMIALYSFGGGVETAFTYLIFGKSGKYLYLLMYVLALLFSELPKYLKNKDNAHYASLGASGGVSAVMFAMVLLTPGTEIGFFFLPIGIPGFIFAPLYIAISIWLEKQGGTNIGHSAHVFGALFGLGFVIIVSRIVADFDAISYCLAGIQQYFN